MELSDKNKDRLREVGSSGSNVFVDYEKESANLNRPRKISDYRGMLSDGTVEALFNILTMPILASEYSVLPGDDSHEAKIQADFVRGNLLKESHRGGIETPFGLFLDQSMMALVDGFQVWEKVYRLSGGRYELKKLALRESRSVEIMSDSKGGYVGVRQQQEDGSFVDIPAHKTFLFTHGKRHDALYGRSAFTALWQNYDKKRKLEYLDSIALQNDAIKPKVLKSTGGSMVNPDARSMNKALQVLGRLGKVNSVASLPENYEIEVLNSDGRDPHQSIERQNSEMARVFLANFMLLGSQGASSTGSFALSDTQSKMFRMSLESIMNSLAAHIEQYIIADLIDINFSRPLYPRFEFEKLDTEVIGAVFNAFTALIQKDRVSNAMASEIEDATAVRLGFDIEKIRGQREQAVAEGRLDEEASGPSDKTAGINLSDDSSDAQGEPDGLKRLGERWKELEDRFLGQIRPVYEHVADRIADQVVAARSLDDIAPSVFPAEYRRIIVSFFKQGYQLGKISASDELGLPAPKSNQSLTRAAVEYISWIIEKQQIDVVNYAKELVVGHMTLSDESEDDRREEVFKLLMAWFAAKLLATASYAISQAVNSGRNSVWNEGDLLKYSAIIDGKTSAGCSVLNGKVMTWAEWQINPDYLPPRHFNCRSTFVKIVDRKSDDKIEAPDRDKVRKVDEITTRKKESLNIPRGVTKNNVISSLKLEKSDPNYLTPAEESFMSRWGEKLDVKRIPNTRDGRAKNDFIINNKEVELKSIHVESLRPMTIPNIIFKATDKGKRNIYIDIVSSLDADDVAARIERHLSIKRNNDLVDEITVFKGGRRIKIK